MLGVSVSRRTLPSWLVRRQFEIKGHNSLSLHFPGGNYSSVLDCFRQTWREGGPRAFYKGFTSNFARLGAWNSAMFVLLEQARAVLR